MGNFTGTRQLFIATLCMVSLLMPAITHAANKMETGFFESLDLAPDVFVERSGVKVRKAKKSGSTVNKTVKTKTSPVPAATPLKSNLSTTQSTELPEMWQYGLLTLIAIVFIVMLLVLLKIHRNTREVESTDNIVLQIKSLSNDLESQSKSVRDVKLRIQKTENSFLKVLAHHIDDKNEQLLKDVDMQFQDFAAGNKAAAQQYNSINSRIGEIEGLLGTLKEFVAEQKVEIRRMQDGYDWSVVNGLCVGMIDVVDRIDEELQETTKKSEVERLKEIRGLLVIMLETHHIKELLPDENKDYSDIESDEFCQIERINGDEKKEGLTGQLARVVKTGFIYQGAQGDDKVVRVARLDVYR